MTSNTKLHHKVILKKDGTEVGVFHAVVQDGFYNGTITWQGNRSGTEQKDAMQRIAGKTIEELFKNAQTYLNKVECTLKQI